MTPKVYLETSFISYLASTGSRDLIVAANQRLSHEWWTRRRSHFELWASELVIEECEQGDDASAQRRLALLEEVPMLALAPEAEALAGLFQRRRLLPAHASRDALHVAVATVYGIDFLLTWNCKHIANAQVLVRLAQVCQGEGYRLPFVCTPYELMGAR